MKKLTFQLQIAIMIIAFLIIALLATTIKAQTIQKQKPTFGKNVKTEIRIQCIAICQTGYQCKRNNNTSSVYCTQHNKMYLAQLKRKI